MLFFPMKFIRISECFKFYQGAFARNPSSRHTMFLNGLYNSSPDSIQLRFLLPCLQQRSANDLVQKWFLTLNRTPLLILRTLVYNTGRYVRFLAHPILISITSTPGILKDHLNLRIKIKPFAYYFHTPSFALRWHHPVPAFSTFFQNSFLMLSALPMLSIPH